MRSVLRGMLLAGAVAGVAILVGPSPVLAQKGGGDPVKITTIDGVELHAMFYPSPKKESPTVILLHKIGDAAVNRKDFTAVADELQAKNYSVMLFDFRGQGKSKDIDLDKFWAVPFNRQHVKGDPKKKTTLELADI